MHAFFRIVLLLDWLAGLAWLWRVLVWRRNLKKVPDLIRDAAPNPTPAFSRVSVIVPARNEAAGIEATLRSLLSSEGVELEILAVDDRSEDATGSIMDDIAEEFERSEAGGKTLRVLHVTELPSGWLGKTHAMALAARHATGEWLLFTDGDVLFHPDALCRALAFAVSSQADHFVLLPTLLLESWGERMAMSFLHVMTIWALRFWRVPDPRALRDVIGVGAFNMIQRRVYDAIGGWESLRTEVIEDLVLGMRVKGRGFTQRVAFGRGLVRVRWVQGAFGVVENLSKNLFAFFRFRVELLVGFLPLFILLTLFPFAALFAGDGAWWATGIMLFAVLLAYQRQAKYQPFSAWMMVTFPVASLLILYTMIRSMVVVLKAGGIVWRGTFYPLSDLRKSKK